MQATLGFYWKIVNSILPDVIEGAKLLTHKAEKQKKPASEVERTNTLQIGVEN